MARLGQGIMPQLGAINYSPILQGSLAAAEGQMRGSEAVARGLQTLGAGVSQGIERYEAQKKENKEKEASIKSGLAFLDSFSGIVKGLPNSELKTSLSNSIDNVRAQAIDPNLSANQKSQILQNSLSNFANTLSIGMSVEKEADRRNQEMQDRLAIRTAASVMAAGGKNPLAQLGAMGVPLSKEAVNFITSQQESQAAIDKAMAEAAALRRGKPENLTFQEATYNALLSDFSSKQGRRPTAAEEVSLRERAYRMGQQPIATPEDEAKRQYFGKRAQEFAEYRSMIEQAARVGVESNDVINRTIDILSSGKVQTGVGQEVIDTLKGAVNTVLGTGAFDLSAQEETKRNFADFAVAASSRLQKQGQITESERKLIRDTVSQYGNTVEGNIRIMKIMIAINNRTAALNDYFSDIESQGKIPTGSDGVKFLKENPLSAFGEIGVVNDDAAVKNALRIVGSSGSGTKNP